MFFSFFGGLSGDFRRTSLVFSRLVPGHSYFKTTPLLGKTFPPT